MDTGPLNLRSARCNGSQYGYGHATATEMTRLAGLLYLGDEPKQLRRFGNVDVTFPSGHGWLPPYKRM